MDVQRSFSIRVARAVAAIDESAVVGPVVIIIASQLPRSSVESIIICFEGML